MNIVCVGDVIRLLNNIRDDSRTDHCVDTQPYCTVIDVAYYSKMYSCCLKITSFDNGVWMVVFAGLADEYQYRAL